MKKNAPEVKALLKKIRAEPEKVQAYHCEECGQWYAEENEASECCPRDAGESDGWECPDCGEVYQTIEEAEDCCFGDDGK